MRRNQKRVAERVRFPKLVVLKTIFQFIWKLPLDTNLIRLPEQIAPKDHRLRGKDGDSTENRQSILPGQSGKQKREFFMTRQKILA